MTAARTVRSACLLALILAGLSACRAGTTPPPAAGDSREITTLASGMQCAHDAVTPTARWLDTPDALQAAYRRMTQHILGANTLPSSPPDFREYGILQVFMGRQTTGGYRLRLLQPRLGHAATGATVHIEWLSPPPGALTPQIITSPCLLLAIPRGDFQTVTVIDQAGRVRATSRLP